MIVKRLPSGAGCSVLEIDYRKGRERNRSPGKVQSTDDAAAHIGVDTTVLDIVWSEFEMRFWIGFQMQF